MDKRYIKMSDDKKVALIPINDFTMKDMEAIEKFKEGGLLGLASFKDSDVERCQSLYTDGKTYRQIAQITKLDKTTILFLAHKFQWWEMRSQYLEELSVTLPQKVIQAKLQSQEFFLHLELAYKKKIGRDLDKYLRTDDPSHMDNIDMKDVGVLMKITELIHKLNNESFGTPNEKTLVALNGLGEGITLTKTGSNSVEITPKPSLMSSKLKQFADLKRTLEQEKNLPKSKPSDIVVEERNNKTESESDE